MNLSKQGNPHKYERNLAFTLSFFQVPVPGGNIPCNLTAMQRLELR